MLSKRHVSQFLMLVAALIGLNTVQAQGTKAVRIHDIQGPGHLSPLAGQDVTDVPGIVTAVNDNGFFMQDPTPDKDIATSEGIYVFTKDKPGVSAGDSVTVSGTVQEFRPGKNDPDTLSVTEIAGKVKVKALSSKNPLPLPVVLGSGGRTIPTKIVSRVQGDVEKVKTFDPIYSGLDFFESLEGMRVVVNGAVVIGPANSFGEVVVLADTGSATTGRSFRGGLLLSPDDPNPERIILDNSIYKRLFAVKSFGPLNVGDRILSPVVGVLDYQFDTYRLLVTELITTKAFRLGKTIAVKPTPQQLTIATFNVENLSPKDPQAKVDRLAQLIVTNLRSPDILCVEEVQDESGDTDDGTVAASGTYSRLISAIKAVGGPAYEYRQIDPANNQDGGVPGGNIRQGMLFNPARVSFTDRPGGTSTASTEVVAKGGQAQLSFSPGRVDPENAAWQDSRKPLAGEFVFKGHRLFVIANHLIAKLGDQPVFGRFQPPEQSSEDTRIQQARIISGFVTGILDIEPDANIVVLGDMNDFEFSDSIAALKGAQQLFSLVDTLPRDRRYSYIYQGNSEVLDQILVSRNLLKSATVQYEIVHVNAEFADQASDHDPSLVRLLIVR